LPFRNYRREQDAASACLVTVSQLPGRPGVPFRLCRRRLGKSLGRGVDRHECVRREGERQSSGLPV